jgi:hypothetical protein
MEDSANMEAMSSVEIMVQKALAQLENFRILDTHTYDVSFIWFWKRMRVADASDSWAGWKLFVQKKGWSDSYKKTVRNIEWPVV